MWARVASEGEALLLARPILNDQLRKHFEDRGIRDAMVGPLRTDTGVVGTMTIGNHLGDASTFDAEDLRLLEVIERQSARLRNHQGAGIPEDLTERVFDRFFQVDQTNTRASGGTGPRPDISRRLAKMIGARVWLEDSTGSGSVFSVWIPPSPPVGAHYTPALPVEVDP